MNPADFSVKVKLRATSIEKPAKCSQSSNNQSRLTVHSTSFLRSIEYTSPNLVSIPNPDCNLPASVDLAAITDTVFDTAPFRTKAHLNDVSEPVFYATTRIPESPNTQAKSSQPRGCSVRQV
jgi:hypothetical protein